jgi:group I intron endonuclease
MVKTSGIYTIRLDGTTRVYVGSSDNIVRRWNRHKRELKAGTHPNAKLQSAWAKYGGERFVFEVVEAVPDLSSIVAREQYWMDQLRVLSSGFNLAPFAASLRGILPSAETRSKMSLAKKGVPRTEETKRKISEYQRNKPPANAATCKKISDAKKGFKFSDESKAKMAAAKVGKKQNPAHISSRIAASVAAKKANRLSSPDL